MTHAVERRKSASFHVQTVRKESMPLFCANAPQMGGELADYRKELGRFSFQYATRCLGTAFPASTSSNKQSTTLPLELPAHPHCTASALAPAPCAPNRSSSLGQSRNRCCAGCYSPSSASCTSSRRSAGCVAAPPACSPPLGSPCPESLCLVSTGDTPHHAYIKNRYNCVA